MNEMLMDIDAHNNSHSEPVFPLHHRPREARLGYHNRDDSRLLIKKLYAQLYQASI